MGLCIDFSFVLTIEKRENTAYWQNEAPQHSFVPSTRVSESLSRKYGEF